MLYRESKYNLLIDTDNLGRVLLYNTVTGSVAWFDKDVYTSFHGKETILYDEIDAEVIRLGYVVPKNNDETEKLEFYKNCYIFNTEPKELYFVIAPTLLCNYNCQYCFEKSINHTTTMTEDIWNKTLIFLEKQCKKYSSITNLRITWFGGEPLLQFEHIHKFSQSIILFCRDNGIEYSAFLVTNGLLLNKKIADILYNECNVLESQITFDGMKELYEQQKNSNVADFNTVVQNIVENADLIKFHIRINVDNRNKLDIKPLVHFLLVECKLADKVKLYLSPIKAYSTSTGAEMTSMEHEYLRQEIINYIFENHLEKSIRTKLPSKIATACGAMRNYTAVIGPSGELYRCEHCLGMPKWIIGDVVNGFYRNVSDMKFLNSKTPEKCLECNLLPVCAGGCLADRILHGLDFSCEAYREKIKFNVKLAVKKKIMTGTVKDSIY